MNTHQYSIEELHSQLYLRTKIGVNFPEARPLIAHYCSTGTLESILKNRQIWFSNPLLMNDSEELAFGMLWGRERFRSHEGLKKALGSREHYDLFKNHLDHLFDGFEREGAFDVYIACFAEHHPDNRDGSLSMWRGYGADGNGACVVFDTAKLTEVPSSPLIIGKIEYASRDIRIGWIDRILDVFGELVVLTELPTEKLHAAAWTLFQRLLSLSLYTKHEGFQEEQEWRIVYMKHHDTDNLLTSMLDYHIGPRGIEPKLKFDIKPLPGAADESILIDRLVHSVILGPTAAADIHRKSVLRMLKRLEREALVARVFSSTIPYRSN